MPIPWTLLTGEREMGAFSDAVDNVSRTVRAGETALGEALIASLALHLGVGPGDLVVLPELAYPTYDVGAVLAGARTLARVWPAAPLYALAGLITFTRPYVGVHYPSDVVAGAALGTAIAELAA